MSNEYPAVSDLPPLSPEAPRSLAEMGQQWVDTVYSSADIDSYTRSEAGQEEAEAIYDRHFTPDDANPDVPIDQAVVAEQAALQDPAKQAAYRAEIQALNGRDPGVMEKNKLLGSLREGSMDRMGDWSLDLLAGLYSYAQSCPEPQRMMANQFKGLWRVYLAGRDQTGQTQ